MEEYGALYGFQGNLNKEALELQDLSGTDFPFSILPSV